jgi:hypothetical protein
MLRRFAMTMMIGCAASARSVPADAGPTSTVERCETGEQTTGTTCVLRVVGIVQDQRGAPLADVHASVCSPGICIPAQLDGNGHFAAEIGRFVRGSDFTLHVDGRPGHADAFVRLPDNASGEVDLGTVRALTLSNDQEILRGGGQSLRAGLVTLDVPSDTVVEFALPDIDESARRFRVGEDTRGTTRTFAFGPYGATFTGAARLTLSLGKESAGRSFRVSIAAGEISARELTTDLGTITADSRGDLRVSTTKLTQLILTL